MSTAHVRQLHECQVYSPGVDLPGTAGARLPHLILPAESGRAHPPQALHGSLLASVFGRQYLAGACPAGKQPQLSGRAKHQLQDPLQAELDRHAAG